MTWAPDYASVADLRAYQRVSDSNDDAQMALAVTAASRAIDRACNRQFGSVAAPEARYFTARWDLALLRWVVDIDDLGDSTGLLIAVDTDGSGGYVSSITGPTLMPRNALAVGGVYTALSVSASSPVQLSDREGQVRVTARWGWTSVPPEIKQATLIQASRLLARRDSPFGVTGSAEAGGELRLLARLDPDVALLVRTRYRWWGAV